MTATPYWRLLQHPKWQKKRLEILERNGFECESCGDKEAPLHVHHRYYERGKKPWEYDEISLTSLCETCHLEAERREMLFTKQVAQVWWNSDSVLMGFAAALEYDACPEYVETINFDHGFCPDGFSEGVAAYWGLSTHVVCDLLTAGDGKISIAALRGAGGTTPRERDRAARSA